MLCEHSNHTGMQEKSYESSGQIHTLANINQYDVRKNRKQNAGFKQLRPPKRKQ